MSIHSPIARDTGYFDGRHRRICDCRAGWRKQSIKDNRDLLIVVAMHPNVWSSADTTRESAEAFLEQLQLKATAARTIRRTRPCISSSVNIRNEAAVRKPDPPRVFEFT
jgi:hypothetical protein